ncbi:MAG: hypothetical protein HeimC2_33910 [Candidatus Heimdallarchaeota archaeon LC_2]|nr:MAG: hypothetical protein HeimC2_33910 [Candidatus Heimdallarchaeota archaeon LC_2]
MAPNSISENVKIKRMSMMIVTTSILVFPAYIIFLFNVYFTSVDIDFAIHVRAVILSLILVLCVASFWISLYFLLSEIFKNNVINYYILPSFLFLLVFEPIGYSIFPLSIFNMLTYDSAVSIEQIPSFLELFGLRLILLIITFGIYLFYPAKYQMTN